MFQTTKRKALIVISIVVVVGIVTTLLILLLRPEQGGNTQNAVPVRFIGDGCVTDQGIYFNTSSNLAIRFYDIQAQKTVYLCTKPNCQHKAPRDRLNLQEGDCEAYFTDNGLMTSFDGKLYYTYSVSYNQTDVYQCEPDGTNRRKVGTIEGEMSSFGNYMKDGKLYYVCRVFDEQSSSEWIETIQSFDLASGRVESLTETIRTTQTSYGRYSLCGFYGDQMLYRVNKYSDEMDEVLLLGLNSENGEQTTLLTAKSGDIGPLYMLDEQLLVQVETGDAPVLYDVNPETGELRREELPFGDNENFCGMLDGKYYTRVWLETPDKGPEDEDDYCYRFYEPGRADYTEVNPRINEEYLFQINDETKDFFIGYARDREGVFRDLAVIHKQAFYSGQKEYTVLSQAG